MYKPEYGDPVLTVRIPRAMITAGKICARRHDTTLSELLRRLLAEQLHTDGIDWQTIKTIQGQTSIDEYIEA